MHTNESLKAQDTNCEDWHYQLEDGELYQLTDEELAWLDFVKGRYSIYDHVNDNLDSNGVYTVDTIGMSEALKDDGLYCKAVCLSDNATLQAIFFYSSHD